MTGKTKAVLFLLTAAAPACGGDPQPGTLEVRVYGEEFIEQGIPAAAFSDGWAVSFQQFNVTLSEIKAARGHGAAALMLAGPKTFDLVTGSMGMGALVASGLVDGGSYDHISYTIGPNGSDDALLVKGTATRAGRTVRFDWAFRVKVAHVCHSDTQVDGATSKAELTIHGDHLFYDDLVAAQPNLSFDLIASADGDADGAVTLQELSGKDITREARYQVGSFDVNNLRDFIAHQATTVGHINGEGHCETQVER